VTPQGRPYGTGSWAAIGPIGEPFMSKILIAFLGLGLLTAAIAPASAGFTCESYKDYAGNTITRCN